MAEAKKSNQKEQKGVKGGRVISTRKEVLPVRLNDQELLIAGAQLAEAERSYRDHESEAASIKSRLNAEKKEADARLRERSAVVRNKTEDREVLIQVEEDKSDRRFALEFRLDTDPPTLVTRRPLYEAEKQLNLPIKDNPEIKALAEKAIKENLDAAAIRDLATKKKLDPEKLLAEVNTQKNKVRHLTPTDAKPADSAALRIAKKLWTAGVRSATGAAKVEESAKAEVVAAADVTEALKDIEDRLEKKEEPSKK